MAPRTKGKETPAADGREALWGSPSPSSPGGPSLASTRSGTPRLSSGSNTAPSALPLPPPARFRDRAGLNFNQCRDRAGAGRELIRKRRSGSPDRSALPGSGDSAAPAPSPGSESPQVASGREGGVTAVTRPPLRENAVSRALHQPRSGGSRGRPVPSAAAGLRPAGKPRSPSGGVARARLGETGPSAPSRPRGPGQSGALPRHLETSKLPRGGETGAAPP